MCTKRLDTFPDNFLECLATSQWARSSPWLLTTTRNVGDRVGSAWIQSTCARAAADRPNGARSWPYLESAGLDTWRCNTRRLRALKLHVTLLEPDVISPTNCVRQPFSRSEIGLYKSVVLANRLNLLWGVDWDGIPDGLDPERKVTGVDIVIGCVDTRLARSAIANCVGDWREVDYWLDLGKNADSGQFVLGEPLNQRNRRKRLRLRNLGTLPGSN
jgi:hypothetical protein